MLAMIPNAKMPRIDQRMVQMDLNLVPRPSWSLAFVVVLSIILLRRVYWELTIGARRRRMIKEHGCQPPKHYAHQGLFGKLLGFDVLKQNFEAGKQGRMHEMSRQRNFSSQNTITMRHMQRTIIMTTEPENIKTVLATKFSDFSLGHMRKTVMGPVFGSGIFTSDGAAWEHSRAMIRPSFTRQQVGDMSIYEEHVQHMLTHIPKDGSTVDLQDLFFKLTIDSATELLFGKSTNTLVAGTNNVKADRFADAFAYVTEKMAVDFRTALLNQWMPDKKRAMDSAFIHDFASEIVQEAIETQSDIQKNEGDLKQSYTFLYELLKITQDPYTLRSETLNVLLAGRDTTASLLSHTFFELARHPEVWHKLQLDVERLGGRAPTYEELKSLKYVKFVLNESLRLYPVVPSNTRLARKDTVLPLGGGPDGKSPMFVPAGTPVTYSLWTMHRRQDFYGLDSLEFKPDRWEKLRPGWEYLPFNGGPRICIGQNFALTEASYVMVRILQHFRRIEPRDDRPWSEFQTLTLAVRNGVHVGLFRD